MAKLPVSLSKAVGAWKEVTSNVDRPAGIVLAGDPALVESARAKFSAGGTVPATWVGPLPRLADAIGASGEIILILVRPDQEEDLLGAVKEAGSRGGCVVAVFGGSGADVRFSHPMKGCIRVAVRDDAAGWRRVFAACAHLAADRAAGLARRYPVMRGAVAQSIIHKTAGQNALIGVIFIIPGADMPAMTLNQLKMVLYLAGVYGEEINLDRAIEIVGIIALGFGFRGVARKVAAQIPVFGWVYKGIVGYAATVAVGMAAVKYFEAGAPVSTGKTVDLVRSLTTGCRSGSGAAHCRPSDVSSRPASGERRGF